MPGTAWRGRPAHAWGGGGMAAALAVLVLAASAATGAASTVQVATSTEFTTAFVNPDVDEIVLTSNIILLHDDWAQYTQDNPCRLTANMTISSSPGWLILDMQFLQGKCIISAGVSVVFNGIVMTNARLGDGTNIDIFLYSANAYVDLTDVVRRRLACLPGSQTPQGVEQLPRPADVPGQQQATTVPEFCPYLPGLLQSQQQCYPDALRYLDVAVLSHVSPDQILYAGGYVLHMLNTTNACLAYVNESCIDRNGADSCIISALSSVLGTDLTGVYAATPRVGNSSMLNASTASTDGTNVVAIAVPVAVLGSALIGALAVVAVLVRRRKRKSSRDGLLGKPPPPGKLAAWPGHDPELGPVSTGATSGLAASAAATNGDAPLLKGALAHLGSIHTPRMSDGWELVAHRTTPELAGQADAAVLNTISLGVLLGAGSYGRVYRGRWMGQEVAVKVLQHSMANAQAVAQECDLIMGLRHPHVVRGMHYATWHHAASEEESAALQADAAGSSREDGATEGLAAVHEIGEVASPHGSLQCDHGVDAQTWIVADYCDVGNLYDASRQGRMARHRGKATLLPLLHRLLEVAEGMRFLHSRSILHGDLKSANVLLASAPGTAFSQVAKVSDFGLSRALKKGQTHRSTRTLGTVTHMAPALLRSGKMSQDSDVYAFGIMMWELLTGRLAFSGLHYGEVVERVVLHDERPPVPDGGPEDYALLMTRCWAADPRDRPSFEAAKQCIAMMIEERLVLAREAGDEQLLAAVAGQPGRSMQRNTSASDSNLVTSDSWAQQQAGAGGSASQVALAEAAAAGQLGGPHAANSTATTWPAAASGAAALPPGVTKAAQAPDDAGLSVGWLTRGRGAAAGGPSATAARSGLAPGGPPAGHPAGPPPGPAQVDGYF